MPFLFWFFHSSLPNSSKAHALCCRTQIREGSVDRANRGKDFGFGKEKVVAKGKKFPLKE